MLLGALTLVFCAIFIIFMFGVFTFAINFISATIKYVRYSLHKTNNTIKYLVDKIRSK